MKTLYIFLFFFLIYVFTAGGHLYSLDGEKLFLVTRAMVEEGTFYTEKENFSPYALGPSFLAIPLYIAGKVLSGFVKVLPPIEITRGMCSAFNSFVTALTCGILFNLLRTFSISAKTSFLTTFLYGAGTLAWPYSKYFFPQPLTALFLLAAVSALIKFDLSGGRKWIYRGGFSTGMLIFTRFEGILFFLIGAGYVFTKKDKRVSNLISFFIFPFLFTVFSLLYNYIRSGEYLNPGYGSLSDFSTPLFLGLYGNLLSSGKGAFFYMPAILLPIMGMKFFTYKYKKEAVFVSIVCLTYLVLYSKWWDWSGDWAWGPRLIVGIIPVSFIPAAFLLERVKIRSIAGIFILFISILSIFLQIVSLPVSFNEYLRSAYRFPQIPQSNLRLHHFVPALSPLKAQFALLAERLALLKKGEKASGYDYYGREIHMPVFDFWYINFLGKAPGVRIHILVFLALLFLAWILVLCLIIRVVKYSKA